jgi:hypothetical protein
MFIIWMNAAHPPIGGKTPRQGPRFPNINAPLRRIAYTPEETGRVGMRTVLIRVPTGNLAAELAEIRKWLDKRKSEPRTFTYKRYGNIVAVCVEFDKNSEAEAFKSRLDGPNRQRERDALLFHDSQWALGFPVDNSTAGKETMAQACWWRLMAEEVRAEADGFNLPSARQTMRVVAQAWDRLAEDLERRIARGGR